MEGLKREEEEGAEGSPATRDKRTCARRRVRSVDDVFKRFAL
jgi:hypothetical protein